LASDRQLLLYSVFERHVQSIMFRREGAVTVSSTSSRRSLTVALPLHVCVRPLVCLSHNRLLTREREYWSTVWEKNSFRGACDRRGHFMPGQRSEGLGHVTHKLSGERYCHGIRYMWSLLGIGCICCRTAATWVIFLCDVFTQFSCCRIVSY